MGRFVVKKNTLPYVRQWAVIDSDTGNKVGEYKTTATAISKAIELDKRACEGSRQHGLPNEPHNTSPDFEDALSAASERMGRPCGDPIPKPKKNPKHSNKRPVELD